MQHFHFILPHAANLAAEPQKLGEAKDKAFFTLSKLIVIKKSRKFHFAALKIKPIDSEILRNEK